MAWFAVALLWCGALAHGDVFRLKDGRRLEGTVVREIGDLVSIKTAEGIVTVDRAEILERVAVKTAYDKYQEQLAGVSENDLAAQLRLARWCAAEALAAESTLHYKRVIALDPDHQEAREKLGYIWFAGDWYLDGSPELAARRAELDATPTEGLAEIPADPQPAAPEKRPELPPLPASAKGVALTLDEKLERDPPTRSSMVYELGKVLGTLDQPLRPVTGLDPSKAPLEFRIRIRCFYVKTQDFYNVPLHHIYQGEAEVEIVERAADGTVKIVGTTQAKRPFSASVQLAKEKALEYTYFATVIELCRQLSETPYLRNLGVDPMPEKKK